MIAMYIACWRNFAFRIRMSRAVEGNWETEITREAGAPAERATAYEAGKVLEIGKESSEF